MPFLRVSLTRDRWGTCDRCLLERSRHLPKLSLREPAGEVRSEALRGLGFRYLVVPWPSGGRETVDRFVGEMLPRLTG